MIGPSIGNLDSTSLTVQLVCGFGGGFSRTAVATTGVRHDDEDFLAYHWLFPRDSG
jgi:hypothetical protein